MTQARKNLLWVACILVVCAIGPRLFSSTPSAPEPTAAPATPKPVEVSAEARAAQDIRAGYDQMGAAIKANDCRSFMAVLAPEYTSVNKTGKIEDRAKMKEAVSEALKSMKPVTFSFRVLHATVQGRSAHVKQELTFAATASDPQGKKHSFEAKGKFEDTWSLRPEGWRLSQQKEISSTMMVDGKSMDEPAPATGP